MIVGFAAISAIVGKVSLSAVILVLVAFAEAGLIILGLVMVQNGRESLPREPAERVAEGGY